MRRCFDKRNFAYALAALVLLLLFAANLFYGSIDIPRGEVLSILTGGGAQRDVWRVVVLETRLPQALTALLAGASISVAGLLLQTLFRNPLAGPEVLGVNSGAGLGVALVMLLAGGFSTFGIGGYFAVLGGAFLGALFVIMIILLLATLLRNNMFLLIAGVAVSYMTSSAITLLNYFSTAEGVHSYMIWGMGSFGGVAMSQMPFFAPVTLVLLMVSLALAKPLNALLLGDAYAVNLGVNVKAVRAVALCVTGLLTAVVTAFCGPVSFIGLAVPHIARISLSSNNHLRLIPATIMLGGAVALLCNIVCQLPGQSGLLPLGAITPLIGAPVIIYVVIKNRGLR
ncbi:MAG: iron ABC transporter permease [Bacteroidaceae bacterium]|nr:iron ABC transporter permease [Bacteroidaceae bacterium]